MLNAYANNQTITSNSILPFTSVKIQKGCSTTLENSSIRLSKPGVYAITLTLNAIPSAAGTASVALTNNGVSDLSATTKTVNSLTTLGINQSITTLVSVPNCCTAPARIQFLNTGVGITSADYEVVVTKVC